MRNAVSLGDGLVVTTDNSGGIGEKSHDLVKVSDQLTAYFAARVALLEQWAAQADPIAVLIHNFSGEESWAQYVEGVEKAFRESNMEPSQITGSTETNMDLMQSAVAITMIGKKREVPVTPDLEWYVYGMPLVGDDVLERPGEIASLGLVKEAMENGCVRQIWPVGSTGILSEYRKLTGVPDADIEVDVDVYASAGPATAVLVGITEGDIEQTRRILGNPLRKIIMTDSSQS